MYKRVLMIAAAVWLFQGCGGGDLLDQIQDDLNHGSGGGTTQYTGNTIPDATLAARIVAAHNGYRRELDRGIPDLEWSDVAAHDAKHYADILAQSGLFAHDPHNHDDLASGGYANGPYGENLYAVSRSDDPDQVFLDAVRAWGDEKAHYHYGLIGDSGTCDSGEQCGHYTQIVWKETRKVGCAMAQYTAGDFQGGYVVVCKYTPPGNVIGNAPY